MAPIGPPTPPTARGARPIHWIALSLVCLVVDFALGPTIQFPFVYLVPISMASWYGGRSWGLALAILLPVCRFFFNLVWDPAWLTPIESSINAVIRITVFAAFAFLIDRTARQMRELRHMHLLEGMLGVCSVCKKVRDDRVGSWQTLEAFVAGHPSEFEPDCCPDCKAHNRDVFERR
ncbi:MAG: hypothetical protein ABI665_02900 [Vicinamibacterales bacterium]